MTESNKNEGYTLIRFIGIAIVVIILWLLTWWLTLRFIPDPNAQSAFGDMFGSINALFSGLAMGGIIVAIFLQNKELGFQREDLQLQRNELKQTRKEFEIQNETLKKQRFENTFFQMLNIHLDLKNDLKKSIVENGVFRRSLDIIDDKNIRLTHENNYVFFSEISNIGLLEKILIESFNSFYSQQKSELSNYFLNLYNCFKFVYDSNLININEKLFYSSIIKAQLSTEEASLLFYYSIVPNLGKPKFTFLVNQYNIFENFNLNKLHPCYSKLYDMIFLNINNPFYGINKK